MNTLGEVRPSQLIYTFGVGALMDLPNLSVLVMGLDDWDEKFCKEITEERLLAAMQKRFGPQLGKLLLPPVTTSEDAQNPGRPSLGVPVSPFPRWLRCSVCGIMSSAESGVFSLSTDPRRPDQTRYVHKSCRSTKIPPTAQSMRFLLACKEGHLTDFPWVEFVHEGHTICKGPVLKFREYGASGDASDVVVECTNCDAPYRRMAEAFDKEKRFQCSGHHPHLRLTETEKCKEEAKPILLGASNTWFPVSLSALSIPQATNKLAQVVEEHWGELKDIPNLDVLKYVGAPSRMPFLADYDLAEVWEEIERQKAGPTEGATQELDDLKLPEWQVLSDANPALTSRDFKLRRVAPPQGFESLFEDTVLVERIREVRALMGFNRIESNGDFTEATKVSEERITRITRQSPKWLPASEVRGEGIFLRLKEEKVQEWEERPDVKALEAEFFKSHKAWRSSRHLTPEDGFPFIRFVLLHSLSHALMRQIVLDCGYTAASLRERLYVRKPGEAGGPMAGILIYTAASDSEGTLGGLVDLGQPRTLGRHISHLLHDLSVCGSDPLCAEQTPQTDGRSIVGACCHACLYASETSCERGNKYLDRNTLIPTFALRNTAFFEVK